MKRKSKIKVPTYYTAGTIMPQLKPISSMIDTSMPTPKMQQVPTQQQFAAPKGIPAGGIGNVASGAVDLIGMIGNESTATTDSDVRKQTLQDATKGLATGVTAGMAFGPVGAIVGGVVGLGVGLSGRKGGVDGGGFYEDPTLRLGTGFRAGGNDKLKAKYNKMKAVSSGNRIAAQLDPQMQAYLDTYDTDIQVAAKGGTLNQLALLDDGELYNTPNGVIGKIPEKGQPTDSNLVNAPVGTNVLSDKLKVPGTNKTYAKIAEEMMTKSKSKGKDRYALNAQRLNEMNNQILFNDLFMLQEANKTEKQAEPKVKGIPTHRFGSTIKLFNNSQPDYLGVANSISNINNYGNLMKAENKAKLSTLDTAVDANMARRAKYDMYTDIAEGVGDIGEKLAILGPTIANLKEKPETFEAVYNPYAYEITSTMRSRRDNPTQRIRSISDQAALIDYNARQFNTNTGANMAYRLQNAVNLNKAIADEYARSAALNSGYASDYANTLNSLGGQYVQARNTAIDLNARSRANARNIQREGLSQLSQYVQMNQAMRNKKANDAAMLGLYDDFLRLGIADGKVDSFYNALSKVYGRKYNNI